MVTIQDLLQGGVSFGIRSEDDVFQTRNEFDPEFEWNDPPLETRGSYWAGPWNNRETPQPELSPKCRKAANELWEQINKMSPEQLFHKYFGLGIDGWPYMVRKELNRLAREKLLPLKKRISQWAAKRSAAAADKYEKKAIEDTERLFNQELDRRILIEDTPTQEYKAIIHDQFAEIDRKWTRLEIERENHLKEEQRQKASEAQDWYYRMWYTDKNGTIKKNMSGEEALHLKRSKTDRDFLFEQGIKWVRQQTSPTTLAAGLETMERKFQESRKDCWRKRCYTEVYLTKQQHELLIEEFKKKVSE